jgi:signal transduction histidine kinase/ABC-type multidrug transport system ATPase subunit
MALARPPTRTRPVAPAASVPVLHVEGLARRFGSVEALTGVDLTLRAGEIVALAGENGAGKSTLVRCIAGDLTGDRGRILVMGERLGSDPAAAAAQGVAVVWQDLALCDNLDIASNLLLGRETGRLIRSDTRFHRAARLLLSDLGIPPLDTTRNVGTLSGGQRQLLAFARATRDQPRLLILDEPTAALGVGWSSQVEDMVRRMRDRGTTILLVSHDLDQMFRLADRIAVLRHGRVVADVDPATSHPDDVVALMSGQEVDGSARRQLDRLHGLADRLTSADPSSSLPLILSALGAALGADQLCIHLLDEGRLRCAGALGLGAGLAAAWDDLPTGHAGGPVGLAGATETTVVVSDIAASPIWEPFRRHLGPSGRRSSWSVPVIGTDGLAGVITVLRTAPGRPGRDELDLASLYAGYAASAVERERLLAELTARNRVLETIREVLETLAGPAGPGSALPAALEALRRGLPAASVGLVDQPAGGPQRWRALVGAADHRPDAVAMAPVDGVARPLAGMPRALGVCFPSPTGPVALVAHLDGRVSGGVGGPADATTARSLLEDAARSLQLALEREESERAHQETAALRRSRELQRGFLSRLSHELRTPLTAIRGYASTLLAPDVHWDDASQHRFLSRIAAESTRVGGLVDDLLDFSTIEAGIMRLQPDWCDIGLVLDAAAACLPPQGTATVSVTCDPDLPVVWADHDRLEQVFLNLMDNAVRHNPPGTPVEVAAQAIGDGEVLVSVTDRGSGMPADMADGRFEPRRERRGPTAGAGLGLSIAQGIVDAHGGRLELDRLTTGTRFRIRLPVEGVGTSAAGVIDGAGD